MTTKNKNKAKTEDKIKKGDKMDKKKIITISSIVVAVLIVGGAALYLFMTKDKTPDSNNQGQNTKPVVKDCGELIADKNVTEGKSPFTPLLRSKLNKFSDSKVNICKWSVDGSQLYTSIPVNGSCVFGGRKLISVGEVNIGLEVNNTDCKVDKTVKVTK